MRQKKSTSWDEVANWYNGWVGKRGSHYHRKVAIPTVMELLNLRAKEKVLDVGAGSGVLAPHVVKAGGLYVGIDLSLKMVRLAKRYHGDKARFLQGDVRELDRHKTIKVNSFDAAVFLLSIQDMQPVEEILKVTSERLKPQGRLIIFMIHPCFRVPRQSGWAYDKQRKLSYRRIDHYLSPLSVPMKTHRQGSTRSFHRPLEHYVTALSNAGLTLERLRELPDLPPKHAAKTNNPEIPLFLALRARKT